MGQSCILTPWFGTSKELDILFRLWFDNLIDPFWDTLGVLTTSQAVLPKVNSRLRFCREPICVTRDPYSLMLPAIAMRRGNGQLYLNHKHSRMLVTSKHQVHDYGLCQSSQLGTPNSTYGDTVSIHHMGHFLCWCSRKYCSSCCYSKWIIFTSSVIHY